MCVCEREGERERDRWTDRQADRQRSLAGFWANLPPNNRLNEYPPCPILSLITQLWMSTFSVLYCPWSLGCKYIQLWPPLPSSLSCEWVPFLALITLVYSVISGYLLGDGICCDQWTYRSPWKLHRSRRAVYLICYHCMISSLPSAVRFLRAEMHSAMLRVKSGVIKFKTNIFLLLSRTVWCEPPPLLPPFPYIELQTHKIQKNAYLLWHRHAICKFLG